MTTSAGFTRKASSKERLTPSTVERTNFLIDFIGERRQSQRSVAPLTSCKTQSAFHGKSRVAQLVSRLEKTSPKKPPLAVPEVMDCLDEPSKPKRRYARHLTSTKILNTIFGRDSEKKKWEAASPSSNVVALTGGAIHEPVVIRERKAGGSLGSKPLRKSGSTESGVIRNLIRKRSEGYITVTADEVVKKQRTAVAKHSELFSSHKEAPPLGSALIDISQRELPLKDGENIVLRPLEPRHGDRFVPSLAVEKKALDPISSENASSLTPIRRRTYNATGGLLMRSERRLFQSKSLSRTMTEVESKILPPLYENSGVNEEQQPKKAMKRYMGSHTTSSYQGKKVAAPDASPRRHLIGFLHRTSHLSLTSELSANASFYLIGKCA